MKLFALAAVLFISASMMAQSASAPQVFHSSAAFAGLGTVANGSNINLQVTRSDSPNSDTTMLRFDIFSSSSDLFTDTFGVGFIPNSSLTGDNTKHLNLNVDTSQLSSFQTTTCTFSFITFVSACQPGPVGLIQLDFQQDGSFSQRVMSDTQSVFFQVTVRSHQDSDSASAIANGSVFGIPVTNGSSSTGTNRDSTITITSNN